MRAADDPSWQHYEGVHIRFPACGLVLCVSVPVPHDARAKLAGIALTGPFVVITPFNPRGAMVDAVENERRWERSRQQLQERRISSWEAHGGSADGCHLERGHALRITRELGRELAVEWEQSAFFWFDGEAAFWLLGALVDVPPIRLVGA